MERICWFKEQTVIKGKHAQYMKELKEKGYVTTNS